MTQEEYGTAFRAGFARTVALLRSRGASHDRAEDAAQAAWVRGWERRHQLRDDTVILRWVNAIALNVHRGVIQYEARYEELPELRGDLGIDLAVIDAAKILKCSRPQDRRLFEQQLRGFTPEEIAARTGMSATAIRVRFFRARRAIRATAERQTSERRTFLRAQA